MKAQYGASAHTFQPAQENPKKWKHFISGYLEVGVGFDSPFFNDVLNLQTCSFFDVLPGVSSTIYDWNGELRCKSLVG